MKKPIGIALIVAGALLILVLAGWLLALLSGPSQEDFGELTTPRLVEKPDVQALVVEFDGDPDIVISAAYRGLFRTYYRLKGAPKGAGQPAPIARYENIDTLISSTGAPEAVPWRGFVAIPVPESIETIPEESGEEPYPVSLERLDYGLVAEIVHFGPYEEETAAIRNLEEFITEQGYQIAGLHEEEYIKGPGVPLRSPRRYITIIRYQVSAR